MATNLEQLADEIIETDFLIVGGGLAGLMAAMTARKKGKIDVAVMERANITTSGEIPKGLMGWHALKPLTMAFPAGEPPKMPFLPPGAAPDGLQNMMVGAMGMMNSMKVVAKLEAIGLKFREADGNYNLLDFKHESMRRVEGERGGLMDLMVSGPYRGGDLKEKMARAARESGARIFNRVILTGLITKDGTCVGATGVDTRQGKFLVFKAKAVLISTGGVHRLYPYDYLPFPANLFYGLDFPGNHGGGIAAAYRAGAKVANMEFLFVTGNSPAGPGWQFKMKNAKGEVLEDKYPDVDQAKLQEFFPNTTFLFQPDMFNPEVERDVVCYDLTQATDEQLIVPTWYNAATMPWNLKIQKLQGAETIPKAMHEIRLVTVGLARSFSGIVAMNNRGESSLKNLYIAGDTSCGSGGGATGATSWGYTIGEYVREAASEIKAPEFDAEQLKQLAADRERVMAPLGKKGEHPLELEDYVRQINRNYIYLRKTEPRLNRALELITIAQEKFLSRVGAKSPHELMRAVEVRDIIELSKLHAQASLIRKESRRGTAHFRVDYPNRDDGNWNKAVVFQNLGGEMKYTLEALV
jgi:succinate dehydrogenase/fumarate reductase flavoprotein subunit